MRVLILATDIYTRGGIARYTATLAATLGEMIGRKNVEVLALLNTGHSDEGPGSFCVLKAVSGRPTWRAKIGYAAESLRAARKRYDLVICSHVALTPIAALIERWFGTPFWVACHDAEVWERISFAKLAALRRAQFALPVSRFTGEKLREINGISREKIRVVYNAIPDKFADMLLTGNGNASSSARQASGRRTLLSVGSLARVHEYKGFDTVIRALPRLAVEAPDLIYMIAGKGDNQPRLEALARQLGVRNRITFAGRVSDRELAELYHGCDVFVMPSRASRTNGRWHGEGFGRVYVEAALAGKPVVGSTGGGAAEAVLHERTGLLVDPASASEVSDALSVLLRNPGLGARMGREGRQWASQTFSQASLRAGLAEALREGGHLQ